ncbi:MAG TPA: AsmA family protein [Gammaproteobacteria bacterium]|nr:AsmA family protein [Gammaproteobacteria bacterium]
MKLLKALFFVILLIVGLVIAGISFVVTTLDPNDYKAEIAAQVKKATGRELTLAGDIEWSFFPSLGLTLGKTSLANAPGFGKQPFAELEAVDVHVALLPLLKKQVQAKKILLKGVSLNLEKNAQGKDNWSDLAKGGDQDAKTDPATDSSGGPDIDIQVDGLDLINARLSYKDGQSGTALTIDPLDVRLGQLVFGQPMPADIRFTLHQDQITLSGHIDGPVTLDPPSGLIQVQSKIDANLHMPQDGMDITADFSGKLDADVGKGDYHLANMAMTKIISGEGFPAEGLKIVTQGDVTANLNAQTLNVTDLVTEMLGLKLSGNVSVKKLIDAPEFTGQFQTNEFSPRTLMTDFGLDAPATKDPAVLDKASLSFSLSGNTQSLSLQQIKAQLDDATLSGQFSLRDFARQAMRFDLTIDQLDADRYLPKVTASKTETANSHSPASDDITLPTELLRKLDLNGTARIQKFTINKLKFENASVTLKANQGLLEVTPLSAQAYQGTAKITASIDARQATPAYRTNIHLTGVRSEDILETLFGDRYLSGAANFTASINTSGSSVSGLQKQLDGKFNASFSDGTIKGSKLSAKITEARNFWRKLKGKSPITEEIGKGTKFSSLTATGTITNGIVNNQDLTITAPVFHITGKGRVNLPEKTINYTLSLSEKLKQGKKQLAIPLQIKGPFDDLHFRLRLDSVAKAEAKARLDKEKAKLQQRLDKKKAELQQRLDKEKADKQAELKARAKQKEDELRQKAREKEKELKQKLEDQLQDKLKGLFK